MSKRPCMKDVGPEYLDRSNVAYCLLKVAESVAKGEWAAAVKMLEPVLIVCRKLATRGRTKKGKG